MACSCWTPVGSIRVGLGAVARWAASVESVMDVLDVDAEGTTDVTRTVHFGTPRAVEVEVYTRLLKGCIDLASTKFPKGYTMQNLEVLLRRPLFDLGLQYGHGSTHGIGHFLTVHECKAVASMGLNKIDLFYRKLISILICFLSSF